MSDDLDDDGDEDLVVSNFVGDSVSVLFNDGEGTFAGAFEHASGDRTIAVAIADLDGDQDKDIAVARRVGALGIRILLEKAGGGTTPARAACRTRAGRL